MILKDLLAVGEYCRVIHKANHQLYDRPKKNMIRQNLFARWYCRPDKVDLMEQKLSARSSWSVLKLSWPCTVSLCLWVKGQTTRFSFNSIIFQIFLQWIILLNSVGKQKRLYNEMVYHRLSYSLHVFYICKYKVYKDNGAQIPQKVTSYVSRLFPFWIYWNLK